MPTLLNSLTVISKLNFLIMLKYMQLIVHKALLFFNIPVDWHLQYLHFYSIYLIKTNNKRFRQYILFNRFSRNYSDIKKVKKSICPYYQSNYWRVKAVSRRKNQLHDIVLILNIFVLFALLELL